MRSTLPIGQYIMCLNKVQPEHQSTTTPSIHKIEQHTAYSSDNSQASCDENNIISFGPIKVKPRKRPAPTLSTGRRSKYEVLSPQEEQKRNIRRARNRAAAERVRVSRLNIEQQLLDQIKMLETQQEQLLEDVQKLQHQRLHLETRILTHERMCSNMFMQNSTVQQGNDFSFYSSIENLPVSSQQYDSVINDKLSDFEFDDAFIDSLTNEQTQQNFPESSLCMQISDDLNDFFMN